MHLKVQKVYFLRTVKRIEKNVRSHSMKSKRFSVQNTILQIKKVEALLAHKLPKIDLVNKSGVPYTAGLDILSEPHEFNGRKYPTFKTQLLNKK